MRQLNSSTISDITWNVLQPMVLISSHLALTANLLADVEQLLDAGLVDQFPVPWIFIDKDLGYIGHLLVQRLQITLLIKRVAFAIVGRDAWQGSYLFGVELLHHQIF